MSQAVKPEYGTAFDEHGIPLSARPIPVRHWGRWAAAFCSLLVLVWIVATFAASSIRWSEVPGYVISDAILTGLVGTLKLTFAVMFLAIVLGTLIAVARESGNPILSTYARGFVWIFRGVPTLVQLLLWFNIALVLPYVNFGPLYSGSTNDLMSPFLAALLGLGISESAYMAEIIRGGILSVPPGQIEAARSIGMTRRLTMRRVILPQAVPVIIPPTGNEFIGMLKYTSLAFAVSYSDLLSQANKIYTSNFHVIEVLLAATAWYLILCTVCTVIQARIEKALSQGVSSFRAIAALCRKGSA
jgi:polar amino acid transport system permease protein